MTFASVLGVGIPKQNDLVLDIDTQLDNGLFRYNEDSGSSHAPVSYRYGVLYVVTHIAERTGFQIFMGSLDATFKIRHFYKDGSGTVFTAWKDL